MALPSPVIVVPGIIGSYLRDLYTFPPDIIWAVLTKDYERAALHPNDLLKVLGATKARAYEAQEPAHVRADQLVEAAYKDLVEELRHGLSAKADQPVPVYAFGYDWRQPLEVIEDELAAFIEEVRRRTSLLRHYFKDGYTSDNGKINLVGHSMGGLVIASCIARKGNALKVDKVVTMASPFQGSLEIVVKVTTGAANLGGSAPSPREREAARLTPALYHLAPSFQGALDFESPGLPTTLFDPDLWQPSIFDTISEYIRIHGVEALNQTERNKLAHDIMTAMLNTAKAHRLRLDTLNLATQGLSAKRWLCIVGVNSTTRLRIGIKKRGQSPEFDFRDEDLANNWSDPDEQKRRQTGDGTVPFEGAIPKFLPLQSLVCVRPDDFELFEVADKVALQLAGFHGIMPNMNMLQRLVTRFLADQPDRHGSTWGLPPPGVTRAQWDPPLQGSLNFP